MELLVHNLDLLVDDLPAKPVDRNMYPVVLLPFHDEFFEVSFPLRVFPALSNNIN